MIAKKKVLVTGSEGFIGSHLVEALLEAGWSVRAFVYYNSFNSWGWLEHLSCKQLENVDIFLGDIRDHYSVCKAMEGMDIVFHLAALIGIPYSYSAPDSYVDTNVKGTLNVLQAVRSVGVEKLLVTSTSEVYGTAKYIPIDEKHPRQPQSPYSATKIAADVLADSFYRSFDLPVAIVRPFNTFGPRQSARAIIPSIIVQLMTGVEIIKLGALNPTRDFVFVNDTAKGFIEIAKAEGVIGKEINIATQTDISIGDLANMIIKKINPNVEIQIDPKRLRPANSEVNRLLGSCEELYRLTGWKPEFSFEEGIDLTIEWFRKPKNLECYKAHIYNV